jgi:hypothetical protein
VAFVIESTTFPEPDDTPVMPAVLPTSDSTGIKLSLFGTMRLGSPGFLMVPDKRPLFVSLLQWMV